MNRKAALEAVAAEALKYDRRLLPRCVTGSARAGRCQARYRCARGNRSPRRMLDCAICSTVCCHFPPQGSKKGLELCRKRQVIRCR
jgi:hypothetical protein